MSPSLQRRALVTPATAHMKATPTKQPTQSFGGSSGGSRNGRPLGGSPVITLHSRYISNSLSLFHREKLFEIYKDVLNVYGDHVTGTFVVEQVTQLFNNRHLVACSKDQLGYGGKIKESTVKRWLDDVGSGMIASSIGLPRSSKMSMKRPPPQYQPMTHPTPHQQPLVHTGYLSRDNIQDAGRSQLRVWCKQRNLKQHGSPDELRRRLNHHFHR